MKLTVTLAEMIQEVGHVPNKCELENGMKLETFVRKRTGSKGYIASLWQMVNGVQEHLVWYGEGKTPEHAKKDLKDKILNESLNISAL